MKRFTLAEDTIVDPGGFRLVVENHGVLTVGGYVADETRALIADLRKQLEEQQVLAQFWRRAAKDAVDGWNTEEDNHETTRDIARRAVKMALGYIGSYESDICEDKVTEDDRKQCEAWLEQLSEKEPT